MGSFPTMYTFQFPAKRRPACWVSENFERWKMSSRRGFQCTHWLNPVAQSNIVAQSSGGEPPCPPRPVRHADEWFPRAKQPNCVIKCVPAEIIFSTIVKPASKHDIVYSEQLKEFYFFIKDKIRDLGSTANWFSGFCCFSLILLWFFFESPLILLWFFFDSSLILLWFFFDSPLILPWFFFGSYLILELVTFETFVQSDEKT